jgi:FkbM family methyltransferase
MTTTMALAQPRHGRVHRVLRAVTSHYPLRFGAAWVNRRLDRFFGSEDANWALAPGKGDWPTMVLDLSKNLQRKFYYFPSVYGRFYGRGEFNQFVRQRLKPGATFLDIGSNVGFFSLLAAQLVGPEGRVYAFEPEPDISEALRRSAAANGFEHLEVFQLALSNRNGELNFYRARDGTASSLVPEAPGKEGRYEHSHTTPVTTLDELVEQHRIKATEITLMKVDVEGEEPRTVAGMQATLRRAGLPPIWCEVRGPQGSTRAPNTYLPVKEQLVALGYQPYQVVAGERRPLRDEDVVARTDVLFERT